MSWEQTTTWRRKVNSRQPGVGILFQCRVTMWQEKCVWFCFCLTILSATHPMIENREEAEPRSDGTFFMQKNTLSNKYFPFSCRSWLDVFLEATKRSEKASTWKTDEFVSLSWSWFQHSVVQASTWLTLYKHTQHRGERARKRAVDNMWNIWIEHT